MSVLNNNYDKKEVMLAKYLGQSYKFCRYMLCIKLTINFIINVQTFEFQKLLFFELYKKSFRF